MRLFAAGFEKGSLDVGGVGVGWGSAVKVRLSEGTFMRALKYSE